MIEKTKKWGMNLEIFWENFLNFFIQFLYNFLNVAWLAFRTDASEISRSLSIESVNYGGYSISW